MTEDWRSYPPSGPGINVFCMSASHPRKTPLAAYLIRGSSGQWTPRADNTPDGQGMTRRIGERVVQGWQAREPFQRLHEKVDDRRQEISCPLCPQKVMARGERLDAILDDLADSAPAEAWQDGVLPVPLGLLAAKVTSK